MYDIIVGKGSLSWRGGVEGCVPVALGCDVAGVVSHGCGCCDRQCELREEKVNACLLTSHGNWLCLCSCGSATPTPGPHPQPHPLMLVLVVGRCQASCLPAPDWGQCWGQCWGPGGCVLCWCVEKWMCPLRGFLCGWT